MFCWHVIHWYVQKTKLVFFEVSPQAKSCSNGVLIKNAIWLHRIFQILSKFPQVDVKGIHWDHSQIKRCTFLFLVANLVTIPFVLLAHVVSMNCHYLFVFYRPIDNLLQLVTSIIWITSESDIYFSFIFVFLPYPSLSCLLDHNEKRVNPIVLRG